MSAFNPYNGSIRSSLNFLVPHKTEVAPCFYFYF